MTLLTDDLIERGGFAIALAMANNDTPAEAARLVLQAILPDVIQACAKVAEDDAATFRTRLGRALELKHYEQARTEEARTVACDDVATAIRSLVSQEKK